MVKTTEGKLSAKGKKFCIIVSRFNEFVGKRLLDGALDCLHRHECSDDDITVVWVPGSFEIPGVANKIAAREECDSLICLGAVIRGDTPHFDYIAAEVTKGIASVGLSSNIPVVYGVITADTLEQAIDRAGAKAGNKGWFAALSAIEMASLWEIL
jgi:6,7-dimethyl-8-ribityllumazine synthase